MYHPAISLLESDEQSAVELQINAWSSGSCERWKQIVANIHTETALPVGSFVTLLRDFYSGLIDGSSTAESAWITACRGHHFSGPVFSPPLPICLGTATPVASYAALISDSSKIALTAEQCETLIRSIHAKGSPANSREVRLLRRASIGRHAVWATFNDPISDVSPFEHLPKTTEAIRTALGLGECSETETLVLLSYRRDASSITFDLFRPTIAEAGKYCWYRPVSDETAAFGFTLPLLPNPQALKPQPEVVHDEITGESLVFPLYLVV